MKSKFKFLFYVVLLMGTIGTTLLAAKFFGSETSYGQCMYMGGGQWQKPVLSTYYVFWIPTGTQPTGEWVSCNP